MPIYVYRCPAAHEQQIFHRMADDPAVTCADCGQPMRRKPLPVVVHWGGLSPSAGDRNPAVQSVIDNASQHKDIYQGVHE